MKTQSLTKNTLTYLQTHPQHAGQCLETLSTLNRNLQATLTLLSQRLHDLIANNADLDKIGKAQRALAGALNSFHKNLATLGDLHSLFPADPDSQIQIITDADFPDIGSEPHPEPEPEPEIETQPEPDHEPYPEPTPRTCAEPAPAPDPQLAPNVEPEPEYHPPDPPKHPEIPSLDTSSPQFGKPLSQMEQLEQIEQHLQHLLTQATNSKNPPSPA